MPKKHVVGYFILRSGKPCVLNLKLDMRGLLVEHATDATLFLRNDRSLQAAKKQCFAACRRTCRQSKRIATAGHLKFISLSPVTTEKMFSVHPCRSKDAALLHVLELKHHDGNGALTIDQPLVLISPPKPEKKKRSKAPEAIIADL